MDRVVDPSKGANLLYIQRVERIRTMMFPTHRHPLYRRLFVGAYFL
jgi:hypothetical protein